MEGIEEMKGIVKTTPGSSGDWYIRFEPGNGTAYNLWFGPTIDSTQMTKALGVQPGTRIVAWLYENKAMYVAPEGVLHLSYVKEKMECNEEDARQLTRIIARTIGRPAVTA